MKVRVVHIVTAYESVVTILYSKLAALNSLEELDVSVISSPPGVPFDGSPPVKFFPCSIAREINPIVDAESLLRLCAVLKRNHFDIVHSHTAKAGFLTALAARVANVPFVCHSYHGLPFFGGQNSLEYFTYRFLEKLACKYRDHIFSQNRRDLSDCVRLIGSRSKVGFEGNGVDVGFVRAKGHAQVQRGRGLFPEKGFKIALVSRLEPVKRIEDFLAAVDVLCRDGNQLSCVIAGDGYLLETLRRRIVEGGLDQSVRMLGFTKYVLGVIAASDVVVLCSEKEGIPRSLMEAMALERPVIATDVPGTQELVVDNKTGFLVPLGDPAALADRVRILIENPDIGVKMGQAGLDRVVEGFNDLKIAKTLGEFYMDKAKIMGLSMDSFLKAAPACELLDRKG